MSPTQEITLKVNVKELAKEIPLSVILYEHGLSDIFNQLVKTFGIKEVRTELKETEEFLNEGGKL